MMNSPPISLPELWPNIDILQALYEWLLYYSHLYCQALSGREGFDVLTG